jgi:hypothetical protein
VRSRSGSCAGASATFPVRLTVINGVEGEGEGLRFTCRQGRGGCIGEQSKNIASMGAIVGQGWLSDDGLEDG